MPIVSGAEEHVFRWNDLHDQVQLDHKTGFTLLVCYQYGTLPDRFSDHLLTALKGALL